MLHSIKSLPGLQKQAETGVQLLWGTACLFSHPRYAQEGDFSECRCHAMQPSMKKALEVPMS